MYNNIISGIWQENTPHEAGSKVALIVFGFVPFKFILADIVDESKNNEKRKQDDTGDHKQTEKEIIFEFIHRIPP